MSLAGIDRSIRPDVALMAAVAGLVAGVAVADVVHLSNGRTMEGIVVEETAHEVRLRLPFGELGLPRSSVLRIDREVSAFEEYLARKRRLGHDVAQAGDWLELARWARSQGLDHSAREAALVVADLSPADPGLAPLMRGFGYAFDEERREWLPYDELMRRRGYIQSHGRWLSPEEALLVQQDRAAAWRERQDRERRERLIRAMEVMALAQMVEAEEARRERERVASQPYGLPVYGYPVAVWSGVWPTPPHGHHPQLPKHRSAAVRQYQRDIIARPPGSWIPVSPRHSRAGLQRAPDPE